MFWRRCRRGGGFACGVRPWSIRMWRAALKHSGGGRRAGFDAGNTHVLGGHVARAVACVRGVRRAGEGMGKPRVRDDAQSCPSATKAIICPSASPGGGGGIPSVRSSFAWSGFARCARAPLVAAFAPEKIPPRS
uniref:Uncharacterized protein n=1 Tax=Cryptomonas paramaecium TaxID=2898 RepID=A0A7S4PR17_9CRYP|mmetsp:Transcript_1/g.3  ORF Transcript_1/g.3 Transcript_1/m.3 type:complete len:134 (+) Transcript_1:179-580(+)